MDPGFVSALNADVWLSAQSAAGCSHPALPQQLRKVLALFLQPVRVQAWQARRALASRPRKEGL